MTISDTECSLCHKSFATPDDPMGIKRPTVSIIRWNPETQSNTLEAIYCGGEGEYCLHHSFMPTAG